MQLSNSNELLKFYTIDEIQDQYGGVKKEHNDQFTVFGKLYLIQIDHKNRRTYQIKTRSNHYLEKVRDKKLLISTGDRQYLVKDIIINKKLTTIKCNDYQNPTDDLS